MKRQSCLTGLVALSLSACSFDEAQDTAVRGEPASQSSLSQQAETAAETDGVTEAHGSAPTKAAAAIPQRYHGVWDYEGGTCAPESDLRMEVKANEIVFYESYGAVTGADEDGDDAVIALAMEGEGDTWTQSLRLALVGEGAEQRLHTSDGSKPKQPDPLPRKRCE